MIRPTDRRTVLLVELLEGRLPPAAHTIGAAGLLALGPFDSAEVAGYLAAPDQHDLDRVELGRGDTLRAAVSAQLAGSGLRPLLRVFDAAGAEVALNDQDGGDPELTVQAPAAGSYFVGVSSSGNADYDPTTNRTRTPGATAGTYTLAVAVRKGQPLASALAATSFRLEEVTAVWGETVHASFSVNNRGGAAAGAFAVQLVAAADPRFDPASSVELLPEPLVVSGLAAGAEWAKSGYEVVLPGGLAAHDVAPTDLFPGIARLASGPIYVGLRVTPLDPAGGGAALQPGTRRGTDWEALTVVAPQADGVSATAAGSLRVNQGAQYEFTVSPAVGGGLLTATLQLTGAGALPTLTLAGGPAGLWVRVVGTPESPTVTISQPLQPGRYFLLVAADGAADYKLGASYRLDNLTVQTDGALEAGGVERYPVTISTAGQYTATLTGHGLTPRLALYGAAGEVLVYRTQGPAGGAPAELTQYLQPGVYILEVSGSGAGGYRLTTAYTASASTAETVRVDYGALGVAVGDVNNDGRLDFVVVAGRAPPFFGELAVLLGNDHGTFTTGPKTEVPLLADPRQLAVADFNSDGKADVAVATAGASGVVVYLGAGDGSFRPGQPLPFDLNPTAVAVAAADLNGDGAPDLVVGAAADGTVRTFLGDGAGGFRAAAVAAVGDGLAALAAADLDGDGVRDVVATTAGGVAVMLGRGDGTFRRARDLAGTTGAGKVAVADTDRDGNADVVVANAGPNPNGVYSVGVFLGVGGGRFGAMVEVPVATQPLSLAVADVNRDGVPDVVTAGEFTVSYLLGKGGGGFLPQQPAHLPRLTAAGLALADVTRDGVPDLVATVFGTTDRVESAGLAPGLAVLRGNGDGTFQTPTADAETIDGAPAALAAADFNGDGFPDVAATLARDAAVAVRLGNADGTYTVQATIDVGAVPLAIASADLNRDGRADLVVANAGGGTIGVLLGNGDGTFRPQATYPAGAGPCALVLADVNGDAIPDAVVATNTDGVVVTLLGTGDGRFRDTRSGPPAPASAPADRAARLEALTGLVSVAVGDVNGDGKPDLVSADSRGSTTGVRLGAGDGTFGPAAVTRLQYAPRAVTLTDTDRDGKLDLVLLHTDANAVGVLRGRGDGTFGPTERTLIVNRPAAVGVGDVNGDGHSDLVATNADDESVSVFLSDGRGWFQTERVVPVGLAPRAVVLRDVNGDGVSDVLVVNAGAGTLSTLLGRRDGTLVTATELNGVGRSDTPQLIPSGAVDAAGRPVMDAVIVDAAGNLLYRRGRAGTTELDAPVVLNAGKAPVRDAVPLQTAHGWVVAAVAREYDAGPLPGLDVPGRFYEITLYPAQGGGSRFGGVMMLPLPPTRLFAADLTGTGRAGDLVALCGLDGVIQLGLENVGGYLRTLSVGSDASDVTTADFDGDGRNDIAVTHQASGDVTVFFNDADHLFARNTRVRAGLSPVTVVTTSTVSTVLGGAGRVGDGGRATTSYLNLPTALTVDGRGNIYFYDPFWSVARRVDAATGVLTTVAGNWGYGQGGDGGPATSAYLGYVTAMAVDAGGNLFVSETYLGPDFVSTSRVRRVDAAAGVITTVPADPSLPWDRTADDAGNEYFVTGGLIRRTDHETGRTTTVAGVPTPRTVQQLGIGVGYLGETYYADSTTVYRVDGFTGVVTPVAGTGTVSEGMLTSVDALTVAPSGLLYVSDRAADMIFRVNPHTGEVVTVAAFPDGPELEEDYLAADARGNVYVADGVTVRRVDAATGAVATVATNEQLTPAPGHRDEARFYPNPLALDLFGNLFFADGTTVRRVDAVTGAVTTYAGTGGYGGAGDGGPAADAQLRYIRGLALTDGGDLYVVDSQNVLRVVDGRTGVITTVFDLGSRFDRMGGVKGLAVDFYGNILVKGPGPVAGVGLTSKVLRVTTPETTLASAAQPVALTAGHFTPDGRPDLLVVNRGEHSFSVLAGDAAGGFAAPTPWLTTSTSFARNTNYEAGAVVAGRFTRGGAVDDVAVLMRDAGEVWVFGNAGDGSFRRTQSIRVGPGATGLSVTPAGAGGSPDLLVGNGAGDVLRLVGLGDGTFAPPPAVSGTRASIAVQRVSGRPVALVANQQADRVTVQARAAGSFAAVSTLAAEDAGAQLAPGDVTWYALSRDGARADAVVLASGSNSVLVYRATEPAADGTPTFANPVSYPTGTNPVHVSIADVNGDGVPDMLVANAGSNDVSVVFGSYGAGGRWVGTAGPRLRAAGAGPLSADLVANPASPGGSDLAITTRDGRVTVLPGRGQGFFDDGSPRVIDLGTPLAPQAPSYIPQLPVGYVVSAGGDVVRFDAAAGTRSVVSAGQQVLLVQAIDATRVIEVRGGGGVVLATAGGGFTDLAPRGSVAAVPSGVAVLDFASEVLEVLVTSAGSDEIHEYGGRSDSDPADDPITFITTSEFTPLDASSLLVPTLVSTVATAGAARLPAAAGGFGLLDVAGATSLPAGFLERLGEMSDDDLLTTDGEALVALLAPLLLGEYDTSPVGAGPRPPATTRDELLDGAADALERLVEAAQGGKPPAADPEPGPAVPTLMEQVLDALRNLPADVFPATPPAGNPTPPTPPAQPTEPAEPGELGEVLAAPADRAADTGTSSPIDYRVVALAAWLLLGAAPLLPDPDRTAAKPSAAARGESSAGK